MTTKITAALNALSKVPSILPIVTFASQEQKALQAFQLQNKQSVVIANKPVPLTLSNIKNENKKPIEMRLITNPLTIDQDVTITHAVPQESFVNCADIATFRTALSGKVIETQNSLTDPNSIFLAEVANVPKVYTLADMITIHAAKGGTTANRTTGGLYYKDFSGVPSGFVWKYGNTQGRTFSIQCTNNSYNTWVSSYNTPGAQYLAIIRISNWEITDQEYSISGVSFYNTYNKSKTFFTITSDDRSTWAGVASVVAYRNWNIYWYEYVVRGIYKTKKIFSFLTN